MICQLLGIPGEDRQQVCAWGHDVAMTLEPRMSDDPDRRWSTRSSRSPHTCESSSQCVVASRMGPTFLSALIAAEDGGDRLTEAELVGTALLLFVAGFETTVNLIGNGTAGLLAAPQVWARLRREPERWADAIEELLRYDSPVQLTTRIATEDIELAGTTVHRAPRSRWRSAERTGIRRCSVTRTAS